MNYVVLYKKPTIFINSQNYLTHYRLSIDALANEFGLKSLDISKEVYNISNINIKKQKYSNYLKRYIKNHSNKNYDKSYEIIYKKLPNLFRKFVN